MRVKDYLRQYEVATRRIKRLEAKYQELNTIAGCIRSPMDTDGQPRGTISGKPTEEKAVKMADVLLDLEKAKRDALYVQFEVFTVINKVPGVYGDVLAERYINLKTWDEVAKAVGYSVRWTHELHHRGLEYIKHTPSLYNKALNCTL